MQSIALYAQTAWLALGLGLMAAASPSGAAEPASLQLVLRSSATPAGPLVRLGDLVQVVGGEAALGETALGEAAESETAIGEETMHLVLFPAPGRGASRTLTRRELLELLALCDLSPRNVEIVGAEEVTIHPAAGQSRYVVRPALHLIPDASHLRTEPVSPAAARTARPAAAATNQAAKPVERPALVHRNGAVTVHCLAAGVKVTASGKSLAEGAQGDKVLVELADTREKVLAQVLGPQTVQIQVAAK
jgi:hypothetical protein